jgi:uncharacterized protein (TIGR00266 family)
MIEFACPACQKPYRVADKLAGRNGKCKKCGELLQIPHLEVDQSDELQQPAEATAVGHTAVDAVVIEQPVSARQPDAGLPQPEAAATQPAPTQPTAPQPTAPQPTATQPAGATAGTSETKTGTTNQLGYEISQRPDFSMVTINLPPGGKVFAEPSAMVSMSPSVKLEAGFKGGVGKTIGRMLGGESLIINTFTAQDGPAEVMFAGGAAGDVAYYPLNGNSLYLQRGSYMLNSEGVEVSGKWQGAKGFFSGEGLVLLKASGIGDIFFNSYGAILEVDVTAGFIVDTGYIVAFEDSLEYRVTVLPGLRTAGKLKSFFFGGEGLVCQFSGHGRVWIQTRQVGSFLSWANPFRPTKSKG